MKYMKICIINEKKNEIETYINVPDKVTKALKTILDECANRESKILQYTSDLDTRDR